MYLQAAKSTKTASSKASISSFFSKPSSATKNKPVAKEVGNSSNMFDDQFSADPMDVDQCEETSTDKKTEKQTKKQTTDKNNKKRSIVDVHGENRIVLLLRVPFIVFSYLKMMEATRYPQLLKRKKLRKSTRKHRRSRNTHVSSKWKILAMMTVTLCSLHV